MSFSDRVSEMVGIAPDLGKNEAIRDPDFLKHVEQKYLWLMPTMECARSCGICFAEDLMESAKGKGITTISNRVLEAAQALSKLPWRQIILTGGEPTENLTAIDRTLQVLHQGSRVKIITNGDWLFDPDKKTAINELLSKYSPHLSLSVDLSSHDRFEVFKQKVSAMFEVLPPSTSVGVQLRQEESEFVEKKRLLHDSNLNVETHKILDIGNRGGKGIELRLSKVALHGLPQKTAGYYLINGENTDSIRLIANHDAPYLVVRTPADLLSEEGSETPTEVLSRLHSHFRNNKSKNGPEDIDEKTVSDYALAMFKSGNSFIFDLDCSPKARTYIREGYLNAICNRRNISRDELKQQIAERIAETMKEDYRRMQKGWFLVKTGRQIYQRYEYCMGMSSYGIITVFSLSERAREIIRANCDLIRTEKGVYYHYGPERLNPLLSPNALDFWKTVSYYDTIEDLRDTLAFFGLSEQNIRNLCRIKLENIPLEGTINCSVLEECKYGHEDYLVSALELLGEPLLISAYIARLRDREIDDSAIISQLRGIKIGLYRCKNFFERGIDDLLTNEYLCRLLSIESFCSDPSQRRNIALEGVGRRIIALWQAVINLYKTASPDLRKEIEYPLANFFETDSFTPPITSSFQQDLCDLELEAKKLFFGEKWNDIRWVNFASVIPDPARVENARMRKIFSEILRKNQ